MLHRAINLVPMNIENNKCRVCLAEDLQQLFNWNTAVDAFESLTYMEYFQRCTQLLATADDDFPQLLCYNCSSELKDAYGFILKAQKSDQELRLRRKDIKVEKLASLKETGFEWVGVQKHCMQPISRNKAAEAGESLTHIKTSPTRDFLIDQYEPVESDAEVDNDSIITSRESTNTKDALMINMRRRRGRPSKHISTCSRSDEQQVVCEYCNRSFPQRHLKRHISRDHKRQLMLCHACPRTFKDASTLRQHTLIHEENRERNYTCENCGRKFFTQSAYHNHVKIHDTNRQPLFQCDQCEKSFFHKGSLKLHKQHHSGNTLECKICQKRYLRPIDLEIHLRTHSGDTPYKCSYCDKAFTQVGILNKHVRHHEGYRYKCDVCSKEYTHQSTLIQHRKEHTGLPLKCAVCGKGFVKKSKMIRHIGGVHKVKDLDELDKLIVKVKTKKEYRGRILDVS